MTQQEEGISKVPLTTTVEPDCETLSQSPHSLESGEVIWGRGQAPLNMKISKVEVSKQLAIQTSRGN